MEPIKLQSLWMPSYTNIKGVAGQTFTLGEKGITSIIFHPDNDWVEFTIEGRDGKKSRALVSFDGCVASPLEEEKSAGEPDMKYGLDRDPKEHGPLGKAARPSMYPEKKPILPQTDEFKEKLKENVDKIFETPDDELKERARQEVKEWEKKVQKKYGKKRGRPKKK